MLQTTMATVKPSFVPRRSIIRPASSSPKAYANWKKNTMSA